MQQLVLVIVPYAKDIIKVSAITALILLPIVYIINLLLGDPANFWYLMDRPAGASLMDQFPDPSSSLVIYNPYCYSFILFNLSSLFH
jgi:uncharacterized membrane protein YwaF